MATARTCRQCGAEVALTHLGRFEGEDSGVRVALEGLPCYHCVKGHKRFLTPDFPIRLVDTLLKSEGVFEAPAAVKKGLLRARYHCPGCGAELTRESGSHAGTQRSLDLQGSATFEVALQVALYRCPGCGKDASHPTEEVEGAVMRAAANAFRAADIPPG